MLRRPKPTDSESDLLQEQEHFLTSGSTPAASVTRRADKRRVNSGSASNNESCANPRDVVMIADHLDEMPTLTPPKKSCSKKEHVRFENEDPEELLDRHDTHISAVLSRIVERDTSAVPVLLPAFTSMAFPKVLHHSTAAKQGTATGDRKSIFARHIAAQKAKTGCGEKNESKVSIKQGCETRPAQGTTDGPLLVSGQGLGPDRAVESIKIHQENQARLQGMSQSEILEEQKLLLAQLDPRLVDFVRSHKGQNASTSVSNSIEEPVSLLFSPDEPARNAPPPHNSAPDSQEITMDTDEEDETEPPLTLDQLPIKPEKEWLHMDKLEPDKLKWISDLPAPRKQSTKKAMQARFDFSGTLLIPTEDLPTHLGLHHHGEAPELAGYSLQELFLLSRSQLIQQRSLALNTMAHILSKARAGEYSLCVKGNVLASLLDAGILFLLRYSLDDSVEGVMSAAVRALRALLVSTTDEENLDNTFPWLLGMAAFPLVPQVHVEKDEDDESLNESTKETEKEKEERKLDHDVAQQDVIKGLLKMQLLQRLRYILEVLRPSPETVLDILVVLIRIARHSTSAATQILDCPRLMETVISDFLPCSWTPLTSPTSPNSLYGLPVSTAMKLLRVLASAGRHACARILNSLGGKERLSRFLSVEPSELLLESGENICCSTEALRLWAVAASFGQACDLYMDLYPVLVKALQAAHNPSAASESLLVLELQRLNSLLVLLTQVTHTAGCHQELQSALLSSQGAECLPPPPVTWSHVSGLQPTLTGILKGCVRKLDDQSQIFSALSLLPSYLNYMGAYYYQFSLQSSFQPVQCLEELEALTTEVLLPLISSQVFCSMMDSIRSHSVICKPGLSKSAADVVPSLPGLGSFRAKNMSLLGPESPLPLCTAFFYLLDIILTIHRGLTTSFSALILSDSVLAYLQSCVGATPSVCHATAWILCHEHHLVYLILRLAHRVSSFNPKLKVHASLLHQVALALLSWLLPGSEYLAHELMSTMIFNQDLFPEADIGGPEAVTLAELQLQEMSSHSPSLAALLCNSFAQLPSIRACYLTHLAYLEPAVVTSHERHLGRNPWISCQLRPELSGPLLPSDWAFLPLISLYDRIGVSQGGGLQAESLPAGSVQSLTHCLQWLLVLESFREQALKLVPPVARVSRLVCVFLCSSDIFLERPVKEMTWALLRRLTRPGQLEALDLSLPPPGLASFHDLYSALLVQYEAVSFGDSLFGCFILLPLQRRYSVSLRLAVFGEHVSILRSLGVSLEQLPIALEKFTSPAEDSLPLLRLYFRALVTGALRRSWCPVLYAVAVAHLNAFVFSQDAVPQEVETTRRSLLRKTYYLTDEVLRSHLLLFCLPQQHSELGFSTYEQLPPIRACRLQSVIETKGGND